MPTAAHDVPAATYLEILQSMNLHNPDLQTDSPSDDHLLVVSPYTTRPHLLDLYAIEEECALMAMALTSLEPVRDDYATADYALSFNWDEVVQSLRYKCQQTGYIWEEKSFYVIAFRSQIPPETDRSHLIELDEKSHAEATESGGLLKYWFGSPDRTGRNLATCVWRCPQDAVKGGRGEGHKRAMRATCGLYSEWSVERLRLTISNHVTDYRISTW